MQSPNIVFIIFAFYQKNAMTTFGSNVFRTGCAMALNTDACDEPAVGGRVWLLKFA